MSTNKMLFDKWDQKMQQVQMNLQHTNGTKGLKEMSMLNVTSNEPLNLPDQELSLIQNVYRYACIKLKAQGITQLDQSIMTYQQRNNQNTFYQDYTALELNQISHDKKKQLELFIQDVNRVFRKEENQIVYEFLKALNNNFIQNGIMPQTQGLLKLSCQTLQNSLLKQIQKFGRVVRLEGASTNLCYLNGYLNELLNQNEEIQTVSSESLPKNVSIWAFGFYALRCGLKQDLIEYLNQYPFMDEDLMRFLDLLQIDQLQAQNINEQGEILQFEKLDQNFKLLLLNLFSSKGDFVYMDIFSIWDYLWFFVYKSNLFGKLDDQINPLPQLQNQLLKDQEILGPRSQYNPSQKYQILIFSLLFDNFLENFCQANQSSSELTSIWFVFTELKLCDDTLLNKKSQIKDKIFDFLEKASNQEGIKSLAFFTCISNQEIQAILIGEFLLKNKTLKKELFNIDYESKKKLSYFKQTLTRDSYEMVLRKIQNGRWELRKGEAQIQDLRIFEELEMNDQLLEFIYKTTIQNIQDLLQLLLGQRNNSQEQDFRTQKYLDDLLQNLIQKEFVEENQLVSDIQFLKKIQKCLVTQTVNKSMMPLASEFLGTNLMQVFNKNLQQQTKEIFQSLLKYILNILSQEYNKKTDFEYRRKIVEKYRDFFETIREFYFNKVQDQVQFQASSDIRESIEYQLNQIELKFFEKQQ